MLILMTESVYDMKHIAFREIFFPGAGLRGNPSWVVLCSTMCLQQVKCHSLLRLTLS